MTKIVQLSSVHSSFDTRIFYKICQSLTKFGYDVDLIIQHPKNEVVDGVNIIALPVAQKKSDRLFKIFPLILKKAFSYPKQTLFHFHDPELLPIGFVLKFFRYKVIYDVHEDVPKDIMTKKWVHSIFRSMISRSVAKLEKKAVQEFDHIITVVPSITKRFDSENVTEIRNYPIIDSSLKPQNLEAKEDYVIYIGDLTYRRGIHNMVKAVALISDNNLKLYLGGKFSEAGLKEELIISEGWNYTKHLGWVDQKNIQTLLRGAKAGLLTLEPVPSHLESLPNKLFEYMLAGIPVIASDFPLWREIIKGNNCGVLVDPLNPKDIADAIIYLYKNPLKAKEMGENGRRAVIEKYNWQQEEKKLLDLYQKLISQ